MTQSAQAIAADRVFAARKSGTRPLTMLAALRRRIAEIERQAPVLKGMQQPFRWDLGLASIDEHLPVQGLAINALHEITAGAYADTPAAMGFALGLAIRRFGLGGGHLRPLLWCRLCHGNAEWGRLYGHGLLAMGLSRRQFLTISVKKPSALLWAAEEALRSRAFSAVIAEIDQRAIDLTLTRRLSLAAERGSTPGLLVFSHFVAGGTAALSRWQVKARASTPPPFDAHAPGSPAWDLVLERCRGGRPGEWSVEWSHATHCFSLVAPVSSGTVESRLEARRPFTIEHAGPALRAG
jgi:protein ImuA